MQIGISYNTNVKSQFYHTHLLIGYNVPYTVLGVKRKQLKS